VLVVTLARTRKTQAQSKTQCPSIVGPNEVSIWSAKVSGLAAAMAFLLLKIGSHIMKNGNHMMKNVLCSSVFL